jgi:hypothetical protein
MLSAGMNPTDSHSSLDLTIYLLNVNIARIAGPRLFLTEFPSGGRIIVDKPVYRLPRVYEAIPERLSKLTRRMTRRMRVDRYKSELAPKPWRQGGGSPPRPDRRSAPTRSIKPRSF